MKMRQRPQPTTEDNRETMAEIAGWLGDLEGAIKNHTRELARDKTQRLLDFICEVLEAKDAALADAKHELAGFVHRGMGVAVKARIEAETGKMDVMAGGAGVKVNLPTLKDLGYDAKRAESDHRERVEAAAALKGLKP